MLLTDEPDKNTRFTFYQMLILFLAIVLAFAAGAFCAYIYLRPSVDYQPPVIVVNTAETEPESLPDDDIGDFLLQHEYFAADENALNEENTDDADLELPPTAVDNPELPHKPRIILDSLTIETPLIAVVVDDMGINQDRTKDIISLQAPLTSSFLTYGKDLGQYALQAREAGHEIMIHVPMEPKVPANLAPDTLRTDMDEVEIEQIFNKMLNKFAQIRVSGINNHMGSRFTENKEKLGYVMNILKDNKMFFLDSKTTASSKGRELAMEDEVDFAARDVFLDNENNYQYIMGQLAKAEKMAAKKGFAIAICHPKSQTFLALKDWITALPEKNLKLVHVSEIVKAVNQ